MENNLIKTFTKDGIGEIRTKIIDNEPWFVAKDICNILEIVKSRDVVSRLEDDEKGVYTIDTLGGKQETWFINESGLYNLIFTSRKPEAKQFKKWITSEVIPSIRKTGMYATDEILDNPDLLIEIATKLKEERKQRKIAELERDIAKQDKILISTKREATCLNRVSQLSKENNQLKSKLGRCKEYATITAVQRYIKADYQWKKLKDYCIANELQIIDVPDLRYGKVKSYPAQAWYDVYNIDLEDLF